MATKNNPSPTGDCYTKADPDEPIFTLRAKDPIAQFLVAAWAATRARRFGDAKAAMDAAAIRIMRLDLKTETAKIEDAMQCAKDIETWRKKHCPISGES